METSQQIIKSANLLGRIREVRARSVAARESARRVLGEMAGAGTEEVDLARALIDLFHEATWFLRKLEESIVGLLNSGPTNDRYEEIGKFLDFAQVKLTYALPSSNRLAIVVEEEHTCLLVPITQMLVSDHQDLVETVESIEQDMSRVLGAMEGEVNEIRASSGDGPQPQTNTSESRTRLTLAEVSGVLDVEEQSITEGVMAREEVCGYDVAYWYVDDFDTENSFFDVPNVVLRELGAGALIRDSS